MFNSFIHAWEGIVSAFHSEKNMKIHIIIMIIVIILGLVLNISLYEWIICIILFSIVIAGEMMNTAIETVVDIIMPRQNKYAKKAKDIAAGSVFILALGAFIIGVIIFIPKIFYFLYM